MHLLTTLGQAIELSKSALKINFNLLKRFHLWLPCDAVDCIKFVLKRIICACVILVCIDCKRIGPTESYNNFFFTFWSILPIPLLSLDIGCAAFLRNLARTPPLNI